MFSGAHKVAARGAGTKMWGARTWGRTDTGFQQDDAKTPSTATLQIKNREFNQRRRLW